MAEFYRHWNLCLVALYVEFCPKSREFSQHYSICHLPASPVTVLETLVQELMGNDITVNYTQEVTQTVQSACLLEIWWHNYSATL